MNYKYNIVIDITGLIISIDNMDNKTIAYRKSKKSYHVLIKYPIETEFAYKLINDLKFIKTEHYKT